MTSHNLVKEIILTEEQIQERVAQLAQEIKNYYKDIKKPLVLIGILRGCLPFFSDFMMKLDMECSIEFMYIQSYLGQTSSTIEPRIKFDIFNDIKDRDVLVIEDILDTGKTLAKLLEHLDKKQPKSLKFLTLLDRKVARTVDIKLDWFGFEVPNEFLVGYGLDYQEILRNLPYIAVLDIDKAKALEKNKNFY